jgi:iron complex transport system substrate-binding protein
MKVKKILAVIIVVIIITSVFSGCNTGKSTGGYLTFTDTSGAEIVLSEEPMKVVSLAPSVTEIIYALGAGERLIGRTKYCNYPAEAEKVEIIGTLKEPNIEVIISLEPDIVIAAAHFPEETGKILKEAGIKVAVIYGENSFESVYDSINTMAEIFNKERNGKKIVNDMKAKVEKVEKKVKGIQDKKTVYYALSAGKSDYTATGDTFISDMFEMAGGINIAKDATGWGYNKETLLEKDPDVIIASDYVKAEDFMKMEPYNELSASKNKKVYNMSTADMLNISGPRLADGLTELAEIIYPEIFK